MQYQRFISRPGLSVFPRGRPAVVEQRRFPKLPWRRTPKPVQLVQHSRLWQGLCWASNTKKRSELREVRCHTIRESTPFRTKRASRKREPPIIPGEPRDTAIQMANRWLGNSKTRRPPGRKAQQFRPPIEGSLSPTQNARTNATKFRYRVRV
jgi:hypothetical protein